MGRVSDLVAGADHSPRLFTPLRTQIKEVSVDRPDIRMESEGYACTYDGERTAAANPGEAFVLGIEPFGEQVFTALQVRPGVPTHHRKAQRLLTSYGCARLCASVCGCACVLGGCAHVVPAIGASSAPSRESSRRA